MIYLALALFVATGVGMISTALTSADSAMHVLILLTVVISFYIGIKEHVKELNGEEVSGD